MSTSELLDRPTPNDPEAERSLIGSLLLKPTILDELNGSVRPEDFYAVHLGTIWHEAAQLKHDGYTVDVPLLVGRLQEHHAEAVPSWPAELAALLDVQPTAAHAQFYARRVADMARRRRLLHETIDASRQLYNGAAVGVVQRHLSHALEEVAQRQAAVDYQPMTLAELMTADVSVDYLIDGVMVAAQPMLVAGPVKSLKTSLLLDLALALATGGAFCGYWRVNRAVPVGVMTGESGLATVRDTLRRIATAAGVNPYNVSTLVISERIPRLSDPAHLDAIRRLILDHELQVLAVDPAYLALDGTDAGNVMLFGQQLRAVSELCQSCGVALVLCHHAKKSTGSTCEPMQLADVAWSGFAEHARQWLLVNHRERYDHDTGTHRLWLTAGGSAGHSGLYAVDVAQGHYSDAEGRCWQVTVNTSTEAAEAQGERKAAKAEARAQAAAERDAAKVCSTLAKLPEGATKRGIRDRSGMSGDRINAAVAYLLEAGNIVETTVRTSNHRCGSIGYKLADTEV